MKKLVLAFVVALGASPALACADREGAVPAFSFEGGSFAAGDRVTIASDTVGTFKPGSTGHANEIRAARGQVGELLAGVPRQASDNFVPRPDEPIQLACVLFDAQSWLDVVTGATVDLPAFETTLHSTYLRVLPP